MGGGVTRPAHDKGCLGPDAQILNMAGLTGNLAIGTGGPEAWHSPLDSAKALSKFEGRVG